MKNKTFSIIFILCSLLLLSSCNMTLNAGDLLKAPKLSDTNQALQAAIDSEIGANATRIYPQKGANRASVILDDLNKDGLNEAVCFFTSPKTGDKINFIILSFISGTWKKTGMGSGDGSAIESVEFADFDGNGRKEIAIGWKYLSNTEKGLEVFKIDNDGIKSIYTGAYTEFVVAPSNDDNKKSLVIIDKNQKKKIAQAFLLNYSEDRMLISSTAPMDIDAVEYVSIVAGTTVDKTPAVYVDSKKENLNISTEILTIKNQTIKNVLLSAQSGISSKTERTIPVYCKDINNDSMIEVPFVQPLPGYAKKQAADILWLTNWNVFDGQNFQRITSNFMSLTENYLLTFPSNWIDTVSVEKDSTIERCHNFINSKKGNVLFSIKVFSENEAETSSDFANWQVLATEGDRIYVFKLGSVDQNDAALNISFESVKSLFSVIK